MNREACKADIYGIESELCKLDKYGVNSKSYKADIYIWYRKRIVQVG